MRALHVARVGRWVGALSLGVMALVGSAQVVSAHAHVIASDPAPDAVLAASPPELTLRFDSALADSGNAVTLYRADRSTASGLAPHIVAAKEPSLQTALPSLDPGVYIVAWTSVSGDDGHTLSQFYSFTVGAVPAAIPGPPLAALEVGDTTVALRVDRGDLGPTTIDAAVTDAAGKPIARLQRVIIRFQPVGLNLGEDEIVAPATGSTARTPTFTLGLTGAWQLTVIVRRAGLDDVSAMTRLIVASPPSARLAQAVPTTAARRTAISTAAPTATVPSPAATPASSPTPAALAAVSPTAAPGGTTSPASTWLIPIAVVVVGALIAAIALAARRR